MLKYLFEIFCKDTTIGLCAIEKEKNIFKPKFTTIVTSNINNVSVMFKKSISIGQRIYHL